MGKIVIRPTSTKGVVILGNTKSPPPTVKLANGQTITGQYLNSENGLHQFKLGIGPQEATGMVVNYEGHSSPALDFRGGQAEYRTESGTVSGLNQAPNKAVYGGVGGGGGMGGMGPVPFGQYGMGPANLTGMFPSPFLTNYQPIQSAPYKFTDAKKFAEKFGAFNRGELAKNYNQSRDFALDTLGTELQSLRGYVPAASALKRQETAADNVFNQQQRTQQLDSALPEVRGQLQAQGQRAETYANGRIPDPVQDRAYELGVRSGAADIAAAGGFGARSSVARKASDLMSARERLGIAQAGEGLLTGNINQRAQIELAPTEYSNAGGQVNVMPSQSFSQLQGNNFGQINQNTLLSTPTAYQGQIQQNQFTTSQEQGTRTFNASNTLQNDQFNATNQNSFALQKFGYQAGLAGAYAGAAQTNLNTEVGINQQNQATEAFKEAQKDAQKNNQTGSILGGLATLAPFIPSAISMLSGGGASSGGGGHSRRYRFRYSYRKRYP